MSDIQNRGSTRFEVDQQELEAELREFPFRLPPFAHQAEEWLATRELESWAFFWEQGTGKSKIAIDSLSWLWMQGRIDGVVVVAPNGIHHNWSEEELPKHLPEEVLARTSTFAYKTSSAGAKWHARAMKSLLHHDGLPILCMSYDSIMTDRGRKALWEFLKKREVFYLLDESARIKNPGSKRTKRMIPSGRYAKYRRILTGTPVANNPFDVYAQLQFVDPELWKRNGIQTFLGFKTTFGIWNRATTRDGAQFDQLLGFQQLDRLKCIVDSTSSRVTKDRVLDLPPKLFTKRTFELEPKQRKLYDSLRDEFLVFLEDGELVTAALAIVRLLRLQQIASGYIPPDEDDEPIRDICDRNPRLSLLRELTEDLGHKAIIFSRFNRDRDLIMDALGDSAVRYDGSVHEDDRLEAKRSFQSGDVQFFVANAQIAGEGLTLTAARTVIYYNNSFDLAQRLQSEDRAHRIGQEHPVNYIDLVAQDTVDVHILRSIKNKMDIASRLTGDTLRSWL